MGDWGLMGRLGLDMAVTDPGETRAISIAGMSLAYALAGVLKRMGALAPEAVENAFEAALSSVETAFPADDHSAALARQLLDLMGGQLAAQVRPVASSVAADGGWADLPPATRGVRRRSGISSQRRPGALAR
jgi:hypothetical protein